MLTCCAERLLLPHGTGFIVKAWHPIVNIIISLAQRDGKYYAAVPEMIADIGSESIAVLIQALCSMLYGEAFAGASVVWNTDRSLTKMTVIHFLICSAATFPIAYLIRWMDHTPGGVLRYLRRFEIQIPQAIPSFRTSSTSLTENPASCAMEAKIP